MSGTEEGAQGIDSLLRDLRAVGGRPAARAPLTCEGCEGLLDLYTDDELAGKNVATLYPALHHHITTCEDCAESYHLLRDQLREERGVTASRAAAAPARAAWEARETVWREGKQFRLSYWLNPADLQKTLLHSFLTRRSLREIVPGQKYLFLSAEIESDRAHKVEVELTAIRHLDEPNTIVVLALLSSEVPLPDTVQATLQWGDSMRSAVVDAQGVVRFDAIPLAPLLETERLETAQFAITFES